MMILPLLFGMNVWACPSGELAPMVLAPTKNYLLQVDRRQEVILDGGAALPKITSIQGGPKGKPMLTVLSGLQVLEKGQMKSYPHRISVKMNEMEKDWNRPVDIQGMQDGKAFKVSIHWNDAGTSCYKPVIK